jgi:hypothetical protein
VAQEAVRLLALEALPAGLGNAMEMPWKCHGNDENHWICLYKLWMARVVFWGFSPWKLELHQ